MRLAVVVLSLCLASGCASSPQDFDSSPPPVGNNVPAPNDRLHVETFGEIRVTTAVPSASEANGIFGINPYRKNVQPVWVQIENLGDVPLVFLPAGLDSAYYTPLETAARHYPWNWIIDRSADSNFRQRQMQLRIEPGGKRSGYVFTPVDEGTKSFNVDVFPVGGNPYRMTFFVPVPGLRLDHYDVDFNELYAESEVRELDREGLVEALESLPCCVRDKKDKLYGDPLNIAFIGEIDDLYYTLLRAGWDETETIYGASLLKTGFSALFGTQYRYSPVSALYVFGRSQDAAFQRTRSSINERNHLRIWLAPMRYEGSPVWIGQISRDIGVRFTRKTITTHKIDPAVDDTREFLIEDLAYAQGLAAVGYVGGVGPAPFDEPRGNLTGDPYFTDGLRAVMWVSAKPVSISEIELKNLRGTPGDAATALPARPGILVPSRQ